MRVGVGARRAAVAEADDVALRLERELEVVALAHEAGELLPELPEPLDVRAQPVARRPPRSRGRRRARAAGACTRACACPCSRRPHRRCGRGNRPSGRTRRMRLARARTRAESRARGTAASCGDPRRPSRRGRCRPAAVRASGSATRSRRARRRRAATAPRLRRCRRSPRAGRTRRSPWCRRLRPPRWAAARARARPRSPRPGQSGRMRKRSSLATEMAPDSPNPMIWAARAVE